ncbi:MAG: glycosyltransferase [Prevotella sp.]|nr:glycosyltransferase [Prevotella sp.]
MYKVSVIVPVYGVEHFIGACAESLFSQTYSELEYIFVDDCSPDASVPVLQEVLSRYPERQSQVRIIHNSENRGSGATRSIALAAATGDFVMYADSDDVLMPDAVEKLVKAQQSTGADIVDGGYCRLLPDGTIGETVTPFHGNKETMMRLLLAQNAITHQVWARLIRRSLHTENGVDFIHGINMAEDYCIMPRLLFFATRSYIDDVLYQYRVNETGTFASWLNERHIGSYLSASRVVGEFLRKHDKEHAYTYAYELGMLNTIHRALGIIGIDDIYKWCPYHPTIPLFRLCRALFCHHATRFLLRNVYLLLKGLYVRCH